jgi:RHS repeat-associated protein
MQMPGRQNSYGTGVEYRYGFQGQEKDDEVKGEGNSYNFGARMHDPRVGRFLSLDAHSDKYVGISPYSFVANSPLIYIDPDGNDIVYFDAKGNEVKRTVSDSKFGARVDLKGDGNFSVAPMPNIIKGYEDPKYQQHDYLIAAETHIFNNTSPSDRPKSANGLSLDGAQPVKLSPTLVKAIILEETMLGNYNGSAGQNGKSDIMQANVTTTSGATDWNDNKSQYGLEKNKSATPQQSVHAGISILFSKGLIVSEVKYENNGKTLSESSTVDWKGGNLQSWYEAVKNYNGNNTTDSNGQAHKINYVKSIYENWNNSSYSQDPNYYVPSE